MDQYLTPEDVAHRLQVHVETVLRWARAGELRGAKLARQWRFTAADVEAFVA
ncbi:MAG: helix-turn-helix domain-containing protein, partial [Caldilinea sp.]|nr:helix-turn-helix domain-containing protein [Caldilinea sp.]